MSGFAGDSRRGAYQNRTGVNGFAGRCVATPPRRRVGEKPSDGGPRFSVERLDELRVERPVALALVKVQRALVGVRDSDEDGTGACLSSNRRSGIHQRLADAAAALGLQYRERL